jgi:hypothetical protein
MIRPNLIWDLQKTLHLTQKGLADHLGCSARTIMRGGPTFIASTYARLAADVHPHDRAFAAELAAAAGTTLVGLGLESPVNRGPTPAYLADSILCAAAEAMHVPPGTMRPALVAALERIVALGMTAEEVLKGMAEPPALPAGHPLAED